MRQLRALKYVVEYARKFVYFFNVKNTFPITTLNSFSTLTKQFVGQFP